jgi:hypothetical protein
MKASLSVGYLPRALRQLSLLSPLRPPSRPAQEKETVRKCTHEPPARLYVPPRLLIAGASIRPRNPRSPSLVGWALWVGSGGSGGGKKKGKK